MRPCGFGLRNESRAGVAFAGAPSAAEIWALPPAAAPDDDYDERSPQPKAATPVAAMASARTILLRIGNDLERGTEEI